MVSSAEFKAIAFVCIMDVEPPEPQHRLFQSLFQRVDRTWMADDLQDRRFRNVKIFVLQADKIGREFDELVRLRKRFSKRKFVLQWYGPEEEGELASEMLRAKMVLAIDEAHEDEKVLFKAVENLLSEKREAVSANPLMSSGSLADRIDTAANAIADLRLNSTGLIVDELRSIAKELRQGSTEQEEMERIDPRSKLKKILVAISAIFDAIESNRTASMIVAGCVSALVGNCGWSSTACFSLSMASWFGKDAFLAAVNKLPSVESRTKPLTKYAKASPPRR